MTSSRIVLIFLGIIFLMIIILSSNRMIMGLRERVGNLFSRQTQTARLTPTPTKAASPTVTVSPTPSAIVFQSQNGSVQGNQTTKGNVDKIPSTGAAEIAWLLMGGSMLGGLGIRYFTTKR